MSSRIPEVNVHSRDENTNTQYPQAHAQAGPGGNATASNNEVNNSTLNTITSIAAAALALLKMVFEAKNLIDGMRGGGPQDDIPDYIYEHTADGWRNSKGV
ncbi:MAG: hypothetical protein K1000chlam3_01021 [Chlamydiae bacterium]|nr:hypothetical protein [Chlamydiota bacterium]